METVAREIHLQRARNVIIFQMESRGLLVLYIYVEGNIPISITHIHESYLIPREKFYEYSSEGNVIRYYTNVDSQI